MATLSSCVCCFELITKDMVCLKKCGHVFHGDCVREWIKSTSSCPTCRVKNRSSDILKLYVTAGEAASQSDSQVDGGGDFPGDNKVKVGDLFKKVKDAKKATAKKYESKIRLLRDQLNVLRDSLAKQTVNLESAETRAEQHRKQHLDLKEQFTNLEVGSLHTKFVLKNTAKQLKELQQLLQEKDKELTERKDHDIRFMKKYADLPSLASSTNPGTTLGEAKPGAVDGPAIQKLNRILAMRTEDFKLAEQEAQKWKKKHQKLRTKANAMLDKIKNREAKLFHELQQTRQQLKRVGASERVHQVPLSTSLRAARRDALNVVEHQRSGGGSGSVWPGCRNPDDDDDTAQALHDAGDSRPARKNTMARRTFVAMAKERHRQPPRSGNLLKAAASIQRAGRKVLKKKTVGASPSAGTPISDDPVRMGTKIRVSLQAHQDVEQPLFRKKRLRENMEQARYSSVGGGGEDGVERGGTTRSSGKKVSARAETQAVVCKKRPRAIPSSCTNRGEVSYSPGKGGLAAARTFTKAATAPREHSAYEKAAAQAEAQFQRKQQASAARTTAFFQKSSVIQDQQLRRKKQKKRALNAAVKAGPKGWMSGARPASASVNNMRSFLEQLDGGSSRDAPIVLD